MYDINNKLFETCIARGDRFAAKSENDRVK